MEHNVFLINSGMMIHRIRIVSIEQMKHMIMLRFAMKNRQYVVKNMRVDLISMPFLVAMDNVVNIPVIMDDPHDLNLQFF
jgi:hypothetical protein